MEIAVILEGGLVRGAYIDGKFVEPAVWDFDLQTDDEFKILRADVEALPESDLKRDALTYL